MWSESTSCQAITLAFEEATASSNSGTQVPMVALWKTNALANGEVSAEWDASLKARIVMAAPMHWPRTKTLFGSGWKRLRMSRTSSASSALQRLAWPAAPSERPNPGASIATTSYPASISAGKNLCQENIVQQWPWPCRQSASLLFAGFVGLSTLGIRKPLSSYGLFLDPRVRVAFQPSAVAGRSKGVLGSVEGSSFTCLGSEDGQDMDSQDPRHFKT
mmetsp:Transcript_27450/g.54861  ORF Transcript_27450/g.54861 Transcript_27450/m.54861 type:complete len:218 (+) Transcript_27450:1983-2636(+)